VELFSFFVPVFGHGVADLLLLFAFLRPSDELLEVLLLRRLFVRRLSRRRLFLDGDKMSMVVAVDFDASVDET